jgi:hypothetical protein
MFKRKNKSKPINERIMNRVHVPKDKSKCWEWTGPVNNAGYGMIKGDRSQNEYGMVTVHRAMAKFYCMPIDNTEVQHTCLNKVCVNPDHLVLGNTKTRYERIVKKYGKRFLKPKTPYVECPFCGRTTHVTWYSRVHRDCHPGMLHWYKQKFV